MDFGNSGSMLPHYRFFFLLKLDFVFKEEIFLCNSSERFVDSVWHRKQIPSCVWIYNDDISMPFTQNLLASNQANVIFLLLDLLFTSWYTFVCECRVTPFFIIWWPLVYFKKASVFFEWLERRWETALHCFDKSVNSLVSKSHLHSAI